MKKTVISLAILASSLISTNAYATWGSTIHLESISNITQLNPVINAKIDGIILDPDPSKDISSYKQSTDIHTAKGYIYNVNYPITKGGDGIWDIYALHKPNELYRLDCTIKRQDWQSGTLFDRTNHYCVMSKGSQCYVTGNTDGDMVLHFRQTASESESTKIVKAGNCNHGGSWDGYNDGY